MNPYSDSVVQAFPTDHDGQMYGMTLRDYFAAKAMQGLLGAIDLQDSDAPSSVSQMSYMVADAMIKARSES